MGWLRYSKGMLYRNGTADDGGTLEVVEGFLEGVDIPMFPEAPQKFSPGLDSELKKMAQQLQVTQK